MSPWRLMFSVYYEPDLFSAAVLGCWEDSVWPTLCIYLFYESSCSVTYKSTDRYLTLVSPWTVTVTVKKLNTAQLDVFVIKKLPAGYAFLNETELEPGHKKCKGSLVTMETVEKTLSKVKMLDNFHFCKTTFYHKSLSSLTNIKKKKSIKY